METQIHCTNEKCEYHKNTDEGIVFFKQSGFYKLKDGRKVRRLQCKLCGKKFSTNTFKDTYCQKRPDLNKPIVDLLSSSVTIRRTAKLLKCNRKTVARKLIFAGNKFKKLHGIFLENLFTNHVQFDEMETYIHTKAKPASVSLAVCGNTGKIIDVLACKMPAKGYLATIGRDKYNWTSDDRATCTSSVIATVSTVTHENVMIVSDKKRSYPNLIHAQIPHAEIIQIKSRGKKVDPEIIESLIVGEPSVEEGRKLKSFDMMFLLNHTCAKIRADMARMRRRTWASSKSLEFLNHHLMVYLGWVNGYDVEA
jgi:transposase-like protein